MSFVARAGLIKSRGSMGRVPALRAESVFYFIRQEKRKRRDAIAKLEYKSFYFYSEAMKHMKKDDGDDHLPPLPIHGFNIEEKKDETCDNNDNDVDEEMTHWYNSQNHQDENNFHSQRSPEANLHCFDFVRIWIKQNMRTS